VRYFSVRTWVIGFLHDPANVEQTSSKCVQNIHELLVVCWTFAGSCKHLMTSTTPVSWSQLTTGLSLPQSTTAHARPTYMYLLCIGVSWFESAKLVDCT